MNLLHFMPQILNKLPKQLKSISTSVCVQGIKHKNMNRYTLIFTHFLWMCIYVFFLLFCLPTKTIDRIEIWLDQHYIMLEWRWWWLFIMMSLNMKMKKRTKNQWQLILIGITYFFHGQSIVFRITRTNVRTHVRMICQYLSMHKINWVFWFELIEKWNSNTN